MFYGLGQIAEGDIHAEIARRGITIEEPPPWEPPPDEPPDDEFPITPIIITPPPVTTIPWIPTITEPPEDDFIDDLEPPEEEEKKAFVLSTNTLIALGIGAVVILAVVASKGTGARALPAARPAPRALPPGPTGKRVIVDI